MAFIETQKNFIGQGITFPFLLDRGKPVLYTGLELIRASIRTIVQWPYFSRFFLSEFGSKFESLLEEPNDQILNDMVRVFLVEAITTWEHRVEQVSAEVIRPNKTDIHVSISYLVRNTQVEDNFVFPFYSVKNITA